MLDKLVAFALFTILATAPSVAAQQKAEIKRVPPENTSITSGAEMFGTYCAVCHGVDGKGNGPAAPALAKQPRRWLRQLLGSGPGVSLPFSEGRTALLASWLLAFQRA